jgi:hypothetical protein
VPDFCTCGVQLPPDARFCHKCGKPQYDYPGLEEETAEPPPLPIVVNTAQPPPEISFHNRLAVRIGFFVALILFVPFMFLWLVPFVPLFVAFLSGFFAVRAYTRRTGHSLSIRSGARMGWITGIFSFGIVGVFTTFATLVASTQIASLDRLREYQALLHLTSEQMAETAKRLQDPGSLIAGTLLVFFVILTALPMLGGALGAKVLAKE